MQHRLLIAAGMFLCLCLPWLARVHLFSRHGSTFDYVAWSALLLASFGVTTLAHSHRFLAGLLVAVPASVLVVIVHAVRQLLGYPVDFAGVSGAKYVVILGLVGSFVLAAIGASLASLVACLHARLDSITRSRSEAPPRPVAWFVSLLVFGVPGVAVGLIGQLFTASRVGYFAVPICLALGWCLARDPSFWSRSRTES